MKLKSSTSLLQKTFTTFPFLAACSYPPMRYFYTGGSYSVRGFSYQSIGADNETFEYNHYLYTASFEVQQRLYQDFYLIAFVDTGDATDTIAHSKASTSAGSGILWKTFAGNLELSIAKPITNHSIDPSMRPRLNIILSHPL